MLPAFALVLAASPNIHAALDEPIKALPAALNQNLARVEIDRQLSQPCRKLGVKIAIDDFDGKYSSFEYIRTYRVNHLKFAQDFVRKPTHDPRKCRDDSRHRYVLLHLAGSCSTCYCSVGMNRFWCIRA